MTLSTLRSKVLGSAVTSRPVARDDQATRSSATEHDRMYSVAQMRTALERERARADRAGRTFCVLAFQWDSPTGTEAAQSVLVDLLCRRLRLADEFGWLGNAQIGVLLPDTNPRAARAVAEALLQTYPPALPHVGYRLYAYTSSSSRNDGLPGSRQGGGSSREPARDRFPHPSLPRVPSSAHTQRLQSTRSRSLAASRPGESSSPRSMSALFVRPTPRLKRVVDVMGAIGGLVVCAPIMLGAIALIKIMSPGPVIFRQRRAGLGGVPFTIYKLRTMAIDADARKAALAAANELDGPVFKMARDPRVVPGGRMLRQLSIDEMPQFWNVLRGEMSLVGPRPLALEEANRCEAWQRERLDVMPGLTCTWQVSGRSAIPFADWVRMDIRYARGRSLMEDLRLILQTIPVVLARQGAY